MTQHKESWDQAAARFVQEQQDFAHSEYACTFDKDCSENQKGNLRMAYYIHTATPKNVKAGALPCEISKVPGCRNFTNKEKSSLKNARNYRAFFTSAGGTIF